MGRFLVIGRRGNLETSLIIAKWGVGVKCEIGVVGWKGKIGVVGAGVEDG